MMGTGRGGDVSHATKAPNNARMPQQRPAIGLSIMTYNHTQHKGNNNRGQNRQRHEIKDRRQDQKDYHDDQTGDDAGHARFRSYQYKT
jgi:hypothetical protein